jgi:hypothetical protein
MRQLAQRKSGRLKTNITATARCKRLAAFRGGIRRLHIGLA